MIDLRLLLALAALPLLGCPTEPTDDDDSTEEAAFQPLPESLAAVFEEEAGDLGASGAAVAIWHDGVLYAGTFGTKSPDGGAPIEPTTLFRIGSTTKMMTSASMLAAADRGTLQMSDAVRALLAAEESRWIDG